MFNGHYFEWNQKRIKAIIDYYGHQFFTGKKLLDLGCGYADISGALHRLGAIVTAVDGRQDHLKMVSKVYPAIQIIKGDLDRGWMFFGKTFDITLHLGLLNHLMEFENHLKSVCNSTSFLILEAAVIDSDEMHLSEIVTEHKNNYDGSLNGSSLRISTGTIERILKDNGMTFKRMDQAKFNTKNYIYDWQARNNKHFSPNQRRIWFASKTNHVSVQSNNIINSPNITPGILQNSNIPVKISASPKHPNGAFNKIPVKNNQLLSVSQETYNSNITIDPLKKKIKTAICISGHLRTFETNFRSVLNNLISQYDCDVFIHTWDILGLSYRPTDGNLAKLKTDNFEPLVRELYKPKKMVIEKSRSFESLPLMRAKVIDHRDIPGILAMYYKVEECNKLKKEYELENNFKYDLVIRFRGDLYLEQVFPVDSTTDLNHLYIPLYGNFGGVCDQISFGNSEVMDKYSTIYSSIIGHLNNGAVMHPERLLKFHVDSHHLSIVKVPIKYVIKRANGLVQNNMLLERALGFIR